METLKTILTAASIGCLAAVVAWPALVWAAEKTDEAKRWIRRHKLEALLVAPFVLCAVYTGSTKGTGKVTFPFTDVEKRYLYDAGSYVTNDAVHVAWTRSAVVPSSADFVGAVRPVGSTNDEEWVIFFESTFAETTSPTNIPYIGAQTNDFEFFTTWTPGPSVHTNGVAVIMWQMNYAGETNKFLTYRTGVYLDGFRIAPNPNITNGPPIETGLTVTPTTSAAESEDE